LKIVIVGAKNPETRRMIDAIQAVDAGCELADRSDFVGFIDNNPALHGLTRWGLPVFGGFEELDRLIAEGCMFVNTITGSTLSRYETSRDIVVKGGQFINFIHPSIHRPARIGVGNYIQEGVHLQAEVEIGDNTAINVGCVIAHETRIGHSSFVAPMVSVAGEVTIGDGVFIGTNATVLPRLTIGHWATIGAGAVVLADVPPRAVVVGNPGRILRYNDVRYADGAL
jgi:sugar O-acyltransferase (sialic acid O-acetyltransferase NeuD family)